MVNLNLITTTFTNLTSDPTPIPVQHGNLIYCTDTEELFYDNEDGIRGSISYIICETEAVRISILPHKRQYNTIYFVVLTEKFYIVDPDTSEFIEVINTEQIGSVSKEFIDLRPGFLHDNSKYYAPYVMASSIIMDETMEQENGPSTLQQWLQEGHLSENGYGTKTNFEIREQVIGENIYDLSNVIIPFPIGNYRANGLNFILFKNGHLIPSTDYTVDNGDQLVMTLPEQYFNAGDDLVFIFIYSTIINPGEYIFEINGNDIENGSIPYYKIKNSYATAISENDAYSVTIDDSVTQYETGMEFDINFDTPNSTETPSLNVNDLGGYPIKSHGENIPIGALHGYVSLFYNDDSFEIKSALPTQSTYDVREYVDPDYYATYKVEVDGNPVGVPIQIPRTIQSGVLGCCESDDHPIEGLVTGDPYIDLTIDEENHIYIPVKDLVDQISITQTTPPGTGNAITSITNSGNQMIIHKDTTFLTEADSSRFVSSDGSEISGPITIQPPTEDMNPATKKYVDDISDTLMPKAGGIFTGAVTVQSPITGMNPATKDYVDSIVRPFTIPNSNVDSLGEDLAGNWTINPDHATSPYNFYHDFTITGVSITANITILLTYSAPADFQYQITMPSDGILRLLVSTPPIESLTGSIVISNGTGVYIWVGLSDYKNYMDSVAKSFVDVEVLTTNWTSDSTYIDYPYKSVIYCEGIASDWRMSVYLSYNDKISGMFCPECDSGENSVTIYAKHIPNSTMTIPVISGIKII